MRLLLLCAVLFIAPRVANAACVIHGARPTVSLPTMLSGQEFSFIASPDCETLRFMIRGTDLSKHPQSGESVGPGPQTYKVRLTESEWDAVVAESGSTLTWIVTGRTSAGVTTRMVTTNDLHLDEPVTVDLSMADAQLLGDGYYTIAGTSVSGPGDVDGDGHDDLLIGAAGRSDGGLRRGAAYLVLGPVSAGIRDLTVAADATIVGEEDYDWAGSSVSGAGDVDGDGQVDLLVGAPYATDGGSACLYLGPVTGTLGLSMADATLVGEHLDDRVGDGGLPTSDPDYVNGGVTGAGDVNGDGHDDVLIGTWSHGLSGVAYVVLGPVSGTLDLSVADAKLVGEANGDQAGVSVSDAGDVDADGHDDLLIGANHNDEGGTRAGAAYLVLGPVTGTHDLSVANAKLVGEETSDFAGVSVSGAGDVNGDGHDDMLVGANGNDEGGDAAGAAHLVLGSVTGALDLSMADAKLVGEETRDSTGIRVSDAGDVDGDSRDDLLIGTLNVEGYAHAGAVYLVVGPVSGTLDLSLADVTLVGEHLPDEAYIASGAGDVDGDGLDDVLIGVPRSREGGTLAGAAYLFYGGAL